MPTAQANFYTGISVGPLTLLVVIVHKTKNVQYCKFETPIRAADIYYFTFSALSSLCLDILDVETAQIYIRCTLGFISTVITGQMKIKQDLLHSQM